MSSNIKIKKICQHCGLEFIARTTVTKYCCHKCAQKAYKANVRELRLQLSKTDSQIEVKQTKPNQKTDTYFEIKTLDHLTVKKRHKIPKFQKGKFVYVPRKLIQPILEKILLNEYRR